MKPNLFIIGAPKCGTTSLASYLAEHENIFMSPLKEPYYFSKNIKMKEQISDLGEYENLFKDVSKQHKIIGEASTHYLFSKTAVPDILRYNESARFIVMLRHPIDLFQSLYKERLRSLREEKEMEEAWRRQQERKEGIGIPKHCEDAQLLAYGEWCKIGSQIEQLYSQVDPSQVHIITLGEMKKNTLRVYKQVLDFLELPYDGKMTFKVYNKRKGVRSTSLQYIIKKFSQLKHRLGIHKSLGIHKLNLKREGSGKELTGDFRKELKNYFRDDLKLLKILTGINYLEIDDTD
ncbi:sulfotransferase [Aliifodinibius salipaludis]|uniref:Sulfotransferase n=1 Tax=Fodinibius salipaludis TaxID=2032627 RepID=A0A2A2G7A6_9BACT|nr:sulfotransferase [Aliifodinibius salipaludis]PAU93168.1 sulfotransferase [Aliifodinibius salipaludis]